MCRLERAGRGRGASGGRTALSERSCVYRIDVACVPCVCDFEIISAADLYDDDYRLARVGPCVPYSVDVFVCSMFVLGHVGR